MGHEDHSDLDNAENVATAGATSIYIKCEYPVNNHSHCTVVKLLTNSIMHGLHIDLMKH